jgi:hypothetical protein
LLIVLVAGRVLWLVTCGACLACAEPAKECPEAACESNPANAGSCATTRGTRLLLDQYQVDPFQFVPLRTADGALVSPAAFGWRAPPRASLVVCAFFIELPQFECGDMRNFDKAAAFVDPRRFGAEEPREGTFDLAAAAESNTDEPASYWGAGCWAYTLDEIVGATVLRDVGREQLPASARSTEVCAREGDPCFSASAGRPGRCHAGSCAPYCGEGLSCPDATSCVQGLFQKFSPTQPAGLCKP